ncbi:MAG: site-specific integrase [Planctomycetes bacterium]|nr:site-specific integrase [Planctomycetota bacterium]
MAKPRGWGTGTVDREESGSWFYRYRHAGRRVYRGGFGSKMEAEQALAVRMGDIVAERRDDAGLPPDRRRLKDLSQLAAEWLDRRQHTTRSWRDDRTRWSLHLGPFFGKMRATDVDRAAIRAFIEGKIKAGESKGNTGQIVRCASTFFSDLCERPAETGIEQNPWLRLPRDLRRLCKSDHDPRFTPYVQRLSAVVALFQEMREPQAVAYAIGVCAGLRSCEIIPLDWPSIDEEEPRIDVRRAVRNGRVGPTKDNEARILQGDFLAPLVPVLRAWRLKTGGRGLLFPPEMTRVPKKRMGAFMHPQRLREALRDSSASLGMPEIAEWDKPWSQATRHTFATQWLRGGHSLGELALALGHSATLVTERYAHIKPGTGRDIDPWRMNLLRAPAAVVPMAAGQSTARMATGQVTGQTSTGPGTPSENGQ